MASPDSKGEATPGGPLRCDFCGEQSEHVRRVALDGEYERLRTPHHEQYACPRCSEAKERARVGSQRSTS